MGNRVSTDNTAPRRSSTKKLSRTLDMDESMILSEALLRAAEHGDLDDVSLLMNQGANVDAADGDHWTALMFAARMDYAPIARLLLDRGASVDAVEKDQWTALMLAAHYGHVDVARLLITHGANIEAVDSKHWTPLMLAAEEGQVDVMLLLLDRGANVQAVDTDQWSALMYAVSKGQLNIVRLLLSRGANIHAVEKEHWTVLVIAAIVGHVNILELLLDEGASVDGFDKDQWTPLMFAARNGQVDAVNLLLDRGANIESVDKNRWTALMLAARNDHVDAARLLLDRGANIHAADSNQSTSLTIAALIGHSDIIRLLLDTGANVQAVEKDQWTALMFASRNGHIDVVHMLLNGGADVNSVSDRGLSSLSIAAACGHLEIVGILLSKNADVDVVDGDGDTPLICAAMKGHASIVKRLLEHGADLHVRNYVGKTAVDYATDQNLKDMKRILLQADSLTPIQELCSEHEIILPSQAPQSATTSNVVSLEQVKLLCAAMHETQGLCEFVCSKLFSLAELVQISDGAQKEAMSSTYVTFLHRFHAFLVQYDDKSVIIRIVSCRVIIRECRDLNEELNNTIKLAGNDIFMDSLAFDTQVGIVSKCHIEFMKSALENDGVWLQNLSDQTETLLTLMFELNNRAENYESEQVQLLQQICFRVARCFKVGIPSIPVWFLPSYEVVRSPASQGEYGAANLGIWMGIQVAIQPATFYDKDTRQRFLRENDIWAGLLHPHIIRLYGACHVGEPFFVCEYASKGTLADYLSHQENHHKMWKCLHEAALAVCYLHTNRKVAHRDLRCTNILIGHHGLAKLTNFHLSCYEADFSATGNASVTSSIRWKAPECLSGESDGTFASDVYSFGMTIIEAVTGNLPWVMMSDSVVKHKVMDKSEFIERPSMMSDSQWDLIRRMCASSPSDRMDITTVVQELANLALEERLGSGLGMGI